MKNRCTALSPGMGWRCEKRHDHIAKADKRGEITPRHKAAFVTWTDGEGSRMEDLPVNHVHFRLGDGAGSAEVSFGDEFELDLSKRERAEADLTAWWRAKAEFEIGQTVAKAIEYGSTDLVDIGVDLARVAGQRVDDEQAAEWGIYFYLLGKMSRWRSAMERGDRVSDDTLLDIGVYARMAQRVRESGSWPGTEEDEE